MPTSRIPSNLEEAVVALSAAAGRFGHYTAAINYAPNADDEHHARIEANRAKKDLDEKRRALDAAIEAYVSQMYEGGLELGRAEGMRP